MMASTSQKLFWLSFVLLFVWFSGVLFTVELIKSDILFAGEPDLTFAGAHDYFYLRSTASVFLLGSWVALLGNVIVGCVLWFHTRRAFWSTLLGVILLVLFTSFLLWGVRAD